MCQVSLGLKEVQMGTNDFKYNNVPLFCSKTRQYQYFDVCCPKLALVPPSRYYCDVNWSYHNLCQVSLGLKEVQMVAHDFKYNKVPLFARKTGNINTKMSASPKLALVPASRYYCDVNWSNHNVCSKFH